MSLLTDEHVPRIFINTLRSNGHEVVEARIAFGEATNDERLLRYCRENNHILVTHDKKDFHRLTETEGRSGIVVYTDPNYLRDDPEAAVHTLERVLSQYPQEELTNELVWLDQWRR